MERGILFSKPMQTKCDGHKTFVFADVNRSEFWDKKDGEVTREEALLYDYIGREIIEKYI